MEAVALADEVEQIMRDLKPLYRRILELRLQGYNIDEIAAATQSGERTVRRVLDQVKQQLAQNSEP
jgi:DNA-directed RNA polymerase specialized sigma24 family protein